jgi:MFS family permease
VTDGASSDPFNPDGTGADGDPAGGARGAAAPLGPGHQAGRRFGGLAVLRHRDFRLIALGNMVSQLGFWAQYVAVGWAASSLTDSQFLIALAFSAQFWPTLIFSPLAGILADRSDRRQLVMFGNLAMVVPPLLIGALIMTGAITLGALIVLVFVGGIGQAFTQPATVVYIPALVPADDVQVAITINAGLTNSTRIVGPALAGLIIAAWGVAWGFNINAVSFLAVALACMLVRTRPTARPSTESSKLAELRAGASYARSNPAVARLILLTAVISFCLMHAALMPIFARQVLHGGVSTYGLLSSAPGIGFVLGAVLAAWLHTGRRQRIGLVVASWALGLTLLLVAVSRSIPLTVAALGCFGICQFTVTITATTMLIAATPDAFRGRMMSLFFMFTVGVIPVNSIIAGALASVLGAPLTVGLCGIAVLITAAVFCASGSLSVVRGRIEPQVALTTT